MHQNISDLFINHIYELAQVPINNELHQKTIKTLLDYTGVTLAGAKDLHHLINNYIAISMSQPIIKVIGLEYKTNLANAAFINGISAHVLELDDGDKKAMMHPGAVIISAIMPFVQHYNISLLQLIKGIVIGYEVAIRIAKSVQPECKIKGYHTTGIVGSIGGAIGIAIAMNQPKDKLKDVISVAIAGSAGLLKMQEDDSKLKIYNVGNAAMNAANANIAIMSGFIGPTDPMGGDNGFLSMLNSNPKIEILFEDASQMAIMETYTKVYASCRHAHSAIDAAINLRKKYDFDVNRIRAIKVKLYKLAIKGHDHNHITSIESAKMSIPYSVAVAFLFGNASANEFSSFLIKDKRIIELIQKIEIIHDDSLDEFVPKKRIAIVEVETENGKIVAERVDYPKGEKENPLSDEELEIKIKSLLHASGYPLEFVLELLSYFQNINEHYRAFLKII